MSLGENIKTKRIELNLSQEYVADQLGVSRQAVSKWETGQSDPTAANLTELAALFEISLSELVAPERFAERNADSNGEPQRKFKKYYYERKSKRMIRGKPLVHINIGDGRQAEGIIAIGFSAKGIVSFGFFSRGVFSIGIVSLGVISIAPISIGMIALGALALGLFSIGAVAAGIFAAGAICFGIITAGAVSIGAFSVGALALGHYVAIGDSAEGAIAIGQSEAVGTLFEKLGNLSAAEKEEISELADQAVPFWLSWAKWIFFSFFV
ncbi:MAG: helix-turn-helix transcriptional regulator [Clostridiales bacterium]|nr:helix-turn-helix transcriptional regulator [Clostridiales bacterium]